MPRLNLLGESLKDFAEIAGVIENLDLVITVDTAVAHLAGAVGKPVWILLPYVADWRWLQHREDSPWYPTARLFRQPRFDDCENVISQVKQEMRARFDRERGAPGARRPRRRLRRPALRVPARARRASRAISFSQPGVSYFSSSN